VIGITDRLEGAARGSGHFRGVTTVVTKLLSMAMPDVAYFGQKDAQQTIVVRRLIADLNLPVRIEVCPTVREPDGLAMSSRNALLDPDQRSRARSLSQALETASDLAGRGERSPAVLVEAATQTLRSFGVAPEYVALVDPETLEPLEQLAGEALLAIAARIGDVRLIDNTILEGAPASTSSQQPLQGEAIATCNA
jgi:pantoate--beta-alanine ligase